MGRIFAQWAIVYLGRQFCENYRSSQNLGATIFTEKVTCKLIWTKNGLSYILGRFFHKLIWSPWPVNDQGSMLFSAIFDNFQRKIWRLSQKPFFA
jgi:hypothetical protein